MTPDYLYSSFWDAIKHLDGAGFKILVVVCDKATVNQKLIKVSTQDEKEKHGDKVGFRSINIYNPEEPIYFISDICHLIKTTRNCLNNSARIKKQKDGSQKYVRLLSKNGKQILWQHFVDMFRIDSQNHLRKAPKLTYNHINLNPFNAMRVKLATKILSTTVGNAMEDILGASSLETVKLTWLFDTFFDILNVSNLTDGLSKGKPALEPFREIDDWGFKWLEEDFLGYLEE